MTFIKKNNYLLLIMVLFILFAYAGTIKSQKTIAYEEITVSEGDTLWSLSVNYSENKPFDKWVEEVMKINNLTSAKIRIGEDLRIPTKSVKNSTEHKIATQLAGDGQ